MLTAMLASLRGSVCMYQGEELGLGEAQLRFEDLQDPYGITFWPNFKGRDGCRTPMPWSAEQNQAGFSNGEPWLPLAQSHLNRAVAEQSTDPESTLSYYQAFMQWRNQQVALRTGDIEFIDTPEPILAFYRKADEQTLLCVFNLAAEPQQVNLTTAQAEPCQLKHQSGELQGDVLTLASYGCYFANVVE